MRGKYFNNNKIRPVNNRRDVDKLIDATKKAFMLLSIMALRDTYGFGATRLERYLDKFNELTESYYRGYISVDDLADTIYKETGIKVL